MSDKTRLSIKPPNSTNYIQTEEHNKWKTHHLRKKNAPVSLATALREKKKIVLTIQK